MLSWVFVAVLATLSISLLVLGALWLGLAGDEQGYQYSDSDYRLGAALFISISLLEFSSGWELSGYFCDNSGGPNDGSISSAVNVQIH